MSTIGRRLYQSSHGSLTTACLKKVKWIIKLAFEAIYETEHSLCLSKFLWLYYKQTHIMLLEHVADIMQHIYDRNFYHLFFHWSWQVRNIFYHILLYIINYRIKKLIIPNKHMGSRRDSISEDVKMLF
jgi:hypothetical protein